MKQIVVLVASCLVINNISSAESSISQEVATQTSQLDKEYVKEFTDIIEFVYGSALLSQGGSASIDMMFEGGDLNNKKALDVGCGLGGVDFYLAEKYRVDIVGVDCVRRLVEDATSRKKNYTLLGDVAFMHQETDTDFSDFPNESFDFIFSKECFLHIDNAQKKVVLKNLFRLLKPGGQIIIFDWLVPTHELGANIKKMMKIDNLDLKMLTAQEYTSFLQDAEFINIYLSSKNQYYITFTSDNIKRINIFKKDLITIFGQETYNYCLYSWNLQRKIFKNNEVEVTLIKAHKPVVI